MNQQEQGSDADFAAENYEYGGGYEAPKSMAVPLLIAAIVTLVLALNPSTETLSTGARGLAFLSGRAFGVTVLVGAILFFAVGRRRDPAGWWKIPLILFPIALFGSLGSAGHLRSSEDASLNSIVASGERLVESGGMDAGSLKHSGAGGEAGTIENLMLDFLREAAETNRSYGVEADAIGVADALTPAVLDARGGMAEARRRVVASRELVNRYQTRQTERVAQLSARIGQSDISEQSKREAIEGFEQGARNGLSRSNRVWALELSMLDRIDNILDILDRGGWERRGEQFMFSRQSDLERFNAEIARLQADGREQEDAVRRNEAEMRRNIAAMRRR